MTGAPLTILAEDRAFATTATVEGGATLTEHDIRNHELVRGRRALAYIKAKVGDGASRDVRSTRHAVTTSPLQQL